MKSISPLSWLNDKFISRQKFVDYSIEYSHIYVNEDLSREHLESIEIVKRLINQLDRQGKTYSLSILIDDYNPSEDLLDREDFLKKLELFGLKPDFYVYESRITDYNSYLIKELSGKLGRQYERYINEKPRTPCSFLVASWYLLRLGCFKTNRGTINKVETRKHFYGRKLINVLPNKFEHVENKSNDIILTTKYKSRMKDIETILY